MSLPSHPQAHPESTQAALRRAASDLAGTLEWEALPRTLYATDASAYRELPLAVAFPRTEADIARLIKFASLTPACAA